MATIEALVRKALTGMSAVTGLVGTGDDARIRADNLTQRDTLPAIIIEVDEDHSPDLSGTSARVWADVNVICRATTRTASRALAEAVRLNGTNPGTGLAGYQGTVLSTVLDAWLQYVDLVRTPYQDGSGRYWYDTNMMFRCTAAVVI